MFGYKITTLQISPSFYLSYFFSLSLSSATITITKIYLLCLYIFYSPIFPLMTPFLTIAVVRTLHIYPKHPSHFSAIVTLPAITGTMKISLCLALQFSLFLIFFVIIGIIPFNYPCFLFSFIFLPVIVKFSHPSAVWLLIFHPLISHILTQLDR